MSQLASAKRKLEPADGPVGGQEVTDDGMSMTWR